jgi:L-ribulose-5-phosphate 3-epimerase
VHAIPVHAGIVSDVVQGDNPFAVAAELGFDGVEVVLPHELTDKTLAALGDVQTRWRLEIPSLILGAHNMHGGIADANPVIAARARDDVRTALVWAQELGADTLLVPFFLAADLTDDRAIDRCAAEFRLLCGDAEDAEVTLCFEGSLSAREILSLAAQVDSPAFGCYFDPANLVVAGLDPTTEARTLGPRIRRVHLKDTRERRGDCRLGEGRVDFAACASALAEIGYDGWFVIEGPAADAPDVARDLTFARSMFPALER